MFFKDWIEKRRCEREARRLLTAAFLQGALLQGTSLRPRHASRWVLLGWEAEEGRIITIRFGILRHPRPYPFSTQSHKVIETWVFDVRKGRMEVVRGRNLTREAGGDAAD